MSVTTTKWRFIQFLVEYSKQYKGNENNRILYRRVKHFIMNKNKNLFV